MPHAATAEDASPFLALGTEKTVNPAVFVSGQAHVVNVRVALGSLGQENRLFTETEAVHAGNGVGNGEERLAVVAFNAADKRDFSVHLNRAGIEDGVDAETLHEVRIRRRIEVEFPLRRNHLIGQYGIDVTVETAVVPVVVDRVRTGHERFVTSEHPRFLLFKIIHFSNSCLQNTV